jgi:outer membrane protein assembly factor BamB
MSTDGESRTLFAACNASNSVTVEGSFLQAIDPESGDELWRHETEHEIHSVPAVADGTVFFM